MEKSPLSCKQNGNVDSDHTAQVNGIESNCTANNISVETTERGRGRRNRGKQRDSQQQQQQQHITQINKDNHSNSNTVRNPSPLSQQIEHCEACSRLEVELKKMRSEVNHLKQIENELRQKCDQNSTVKSCLQAKQKENDELEKKYVSRLAIIGPFPFQPNFTFIFTFANRSGYKSLRIHGKRIDKPCSRRTGNWLKSDGSANLLKHNWITNESNGNWSRRNCRGMCCNSRLPNVLIINGSIQFEIGLIAVKIVNCANKCWKMSASNWDAICPPLKSSRKRPNSKVELMSKRYAFRCPNEGQLFFSFFIFRVFLLIGFWLDGIILYYGIAA